MDKTKQEQFAIDAIRLANRLGWSFYQVQLLISDYQETGFNATLLDNELTAGGCHFTKENLDDFIGTCGQLIVLATGGEPTQPEGGKTHSQIIAKMRTAFDINVSERPPTWNPLDAMPENKANFLSAVVLTANRFPYTYAKAISLTRQYTDNNYAPNFTDTRITKAHIEGHNNLATPEHIQQVVTSLASFVALVSGQGSITPANYTEVINIVSSNE